MMNILAWLQNVLSVVRNGLLRTGASLQNAWAAFRARVGGFFQSNAQDGSPTGTFTQRIRANLGKLISRAIALWQRSVQWVSAIVARLGSGPLGGVFRRLRQLGAMIGHVLRRAAQWAGRGFVELWQLVRPLFGRFARRSVSQTNLIIRKIGVKRQYRYTLDDNPLHQLVADLALVLAIVVGLGFWPAIQLWALEDLPSAMASHTWVISAVAGVLPLIVVYARWQHARQSNLPTVWDILTLTCAAAGFFVLLFAGARMFTALTSSDLTLAALAFASLAALAWLVGESTNAYAILIRRPYKVGALLSLAKSLLFVLSGWLILIYLLVINLLDNIQLDSATFLVTIFGAAAGLGLLFALGLYVMSRINWRMPNFAST